MACSSKLRDMKYEDETLAVQDIINGDTLPIVVRTTSVARQEVQTDIPEDTDILFQRVSEETCAHIKVLQFYDNKKVQQEKGGEYVLEHDTFVGNEYLMPLSFHGKVKFVRRPGSRGRYLTIKQVVLFQEIHAEDAVLKDHTLRSAMLTMVEGPIEVLGFKVVEYLIGWIRNKNHKTYETILVPKNIWNKMYIQKLCFYDDEEKQKCIKRKYGQCLISDFVSNSLYLLPLDQCEVSWLRSPDLFKRNSTGDKLYDVVQITFEDSSDDNEEEEVSLYAEIEEPPPPIPKRQPIHPAGKPTKVKRSSSFLNKVRTLFKSRRRDRADEGSVKHIEKPPGRPPKPKFRVNADVQLHNDAVTESDRIPKGECSPIRPLPFLPTDAINRNYTKLIFPETQPVYGTPMVDNCTPNSEQCHAEQNTTNKMSLAFNSNSSQEDFFLYSVEAVSLCLENCGLKHLAKTCSEQMLDGSFFDGFEDWNVLNLSGSDVDFLKKIIYKGWRSRNDSL
ncbi:uncharacterized protein LOC123524705 isoform X2 [Mercenaria mercenaria]|uniref:uncharacterized protein LOC123524705 isoform X2 n=1 Tax=Mercenaria mercenaria TaxID=6596 RepID=UPI00234F8F83|nr:uncharacterized protein LOC123524705 isoform X2 [Mercenaria mercenaria]